KQTLPAPAPGRRPQARHQCGIPGCAGFIPLSGVPVSATPLRVVRPSWKQSNAARVLLQAAKWRSREQGLPCDLTLDDVVIPDRCPVLGIPLITGQSKQGENSATLDRIVGSKGYVKGNVAVISWRANHLKNNATLDEIRRLAAWINKVAPSLRRPLAASKSRSRAAASRSSTPSTLNAYSPTAGSCIAKRTGCLTPKG